MTIRASKNSAGSKMKEGRPAYKEKPLEADLRRLYEAEGRSLRDIAKELGCSKDMVFRWHG